MNSLERVLSAVSGKPADRPAISMTLSLYGARLTGCPLDKYYRDADLYVAGQSAVRETFKPDILFTPFALALEGEAFGSKARFFDYQPPNIVKPAVVSVSEALKLSVPDIDTSLNLLYIREATRKLFSLYGKEVPIAGILLSPADIPALITGIGPWLETLLFEPDTAKRFLEKTAEFFIKWGNTLLSDGANFIAIPGVFSNPGVIGIKVVKEIILPLYKEVFAEIKGPIVMHHGGNPIVPFLEYYSSLPNVLVFVIDPKDSFQEARIKASDKILIGNINGTGLNSMNPDEIIQYCLTILQDRKNDNKFILATSYADIPYDTPPENILSIHKAVETFRNENEK
jgi:uroporphyrinogen decarboxylase